MDSPRPVAPQDRLTILLIADNPSRRVRLTDVLQEEGFSIVHAVDVRDAVRQTRACGLDLIVADLLPNAVAGPVLDHLRHDRTTRRLPLIVIRHPGVHLDISPSGSIDALLSTQVDVDVLLDHVWRAVNTHVLRATPSS